MDDLKKQYLSMTVSDLQNLLQNAVLTPEALRGYRSAKQL
jgi:hypothetical protein